MCIRRVQVCLRAGRRRPKSPQERGDVKKALAVALIVGFLLVDFLFFHDIFKAGEVGRSRSTSPER